MRIWRLVGLTVLVPLVVVSSPERKTAAQVSAVAAGACEKLTALMISDTTITSAQTVAPGAFSPPSAGRGGAAALDPYKKLPAFCRVTAAVNRPRDTDVTIEVWMPVQNWNGDFRPAASGFAGGTIAYGGMAEFLLAGAATANTNRGHDGGGPWKVSDMAGLPYHLMVSKAKAVVGAFYGKGPHFTVMNECGGGGSRDALQLVQDWPDDLDAAAAVGFVYDPTHHGIGQMWVYQATHKSEAHYIPPSKYAIIHQAALDACDLKDGVKDGVIEDPPRCKYDPAVLLCKGGDGPNCLTAPQVEAVRQIYSPAVHAKTGKYLFAPMVPGGELGWEPMAGPAPYGYAPGFYRNMVFRDQTWDYKNGLPNFDTHVDLAEAPENRVIDAANPDLSRFIARGGKLLLLGGWNDHTLAPGSFVDYYEAVVKKMGAQKVRDSVRLFMVPGMDHCLTPAYKPHHDVDLVRILRVWKTSGNAPDQIVVTRFTDEGKEERKRLVCAYPRVAMYKGKGNTTDPANYVCRNRPPTTDH
jgi:feruloyl esterase